MDGFTLFDFGQHLLSLLLDGIRYLSQVGLMTIYGSLHILHFFLEFGALSSELVQLWFNLERGVLQIIN